MPKKEVIEEKEGIKYKFCVICNEWKPLDTDFYTKNVRRQCKGCTNQLNTARNKAHGYYYTPVEKDKRKKDNKPPKQAA